MRRIAPFIALLFVLTGAPFALGEEAQPFVTAKDIDLTRILPPPPANDSAETKAELGVVLPVSFFENKNGKSTKPSSGTRPVR